MKQLYSFTIALLLGSSLMANTTQTVEVPVDELATESVMPVFDKINVVKSKNIKLNKRIEFGGAVGMSLNEPFYKQLIYGGNVTFNFTDVHAINYSFTMWQDGLNNYGKQLKSGEGQEVGNSFDASKAPHVQSLQSLNYQINAYYGKISLTKQYVMNLSLYGFAGLASIDDGDTSRIALNLGIGQKFYLSNNFALRFDLNMFAYEGIDPTSKDLRREQPAPAPSEFSTTTLIGSTLMGSLVILL